MEIIEKEMESVRKWNLFVCVVSDMRKDNHVMFPSPRKGPVL
jgi:hypothetical protein